MPWRVWKGVREFFCVSWSGRHPAFDNHATSRTMPITAPAPTIVNPAARRIYRPALPHRRSACVFLPLNQTFIISLPVSPSTGLDIHRPTVAGALTRQAITVCTPNNAARPMVTKTRCPHRMSGVAGCAGSDKRARRSTMPHIFRKCE